MRFHLRHASAGSSFKLCLLKTSSLCLARRASRPFFFPLASTKPPLSEPGRSFGPFTPPAPLGALGKPSAVFGSHSLEIFLSPLLPGSSPGGRLQPLPLLFRVRLPPGFSSRRRVGVPRTLSTSPFLSIFFEMFFRFFPRLIQATPVHTTINTHIINEMPFCHNPPSCRVFFLNASLFPHPTSPPPRGIQPPSAPSTPLQGRLVFQAHSIPSP